MNARHDAPRTQRELQRQFSHDWGPGRRPMTGGQGSGGGLGTDTALVIWDTGNCRILSHAVSHTEVSCPGTVGEGERKQRGRGEGGCRDGGREKEIDEVHREKESEGQGNFFIIEALLSKMHRCVVTCSAAEGSRACTCHGCCATKAKSVPRAKKCQLALALSLALARALSSLSLSLSLALSRSLALSLSLSHTHTHTFTLTLTLALTLTLTLSLSLTKNLSLSLQIFPLLNLSLFQSLSLSLSLSVSLTSVSCMCDTFLNFNRRTNSTSQERGTCHVEGVRDRARNLGAVAKHPCLLGT
jgi:hypothetical protein